MEFTPFRKIARLSRDVVITEKIDGTNAQVFITSEDTRAERMGWDGLLCNISGMDIYAGSRTRWLSTRQDNYGFAKWVTDNVEELLKLGEGSHFGEWWGQGIQRNYAQTKKRFSLFNTSRWSDPATRPDVCDVVPILYEGPLEDHGVMKGVKASLQRLQSEGSVAAPGFMNPEGIVIYHTHGNILLKKTLHADDKGKERGA